MCRKIISSKIKQWSVNVGECQKIWRKFPSEALKHNYPWTENKVLDFLKPDMMESVADWAAELLPHYSILFYTGQLDIICAYPLVENFLRNLNFDAAEQYKMLSVSFGV